MYILEMKTKNKSVIKVYVFYQYYGYIPMGEQLAK